MQRDNTTFAIYQGNEIDWQQFLTHVLQTSQRLPAKAQAINLCDNRYLFIVAFLAVVVRQQSNLLPANKTSNTIAELLAAFPDSYCLTDDDLDFISNKDCALPAGQIKSQVLINTARVVATAFTSGSTGQPKRIDKTWRELQHGACLAVERFKLSQQPWEIISTVPPQHMYGLETSLFWPLFSSLKINGSRPFFPADICRQVKHCKPSCLLVSTPKHLQACSQTALMWHHLAMILCSTAPLSCNNAESIEKNLCSPLWEIIGSTETLSYASRRTAATQQWQLYATLNLTKTGAGFKLSGGHLQEPITLDDQFEIDADGYFTLQGRSSDLIKVAGKRASLMDLNSILIGLDDVSDAVFYPTEQERLAALVVSKRGKQELLLALKQYIDEVFLPRPLHFVNKLPRNELGKIDKSELKQLIKACEHA